MTQKQAQNLLHSSDKVLVLVALSYVNLTDKELETLILRHMRGHTQEKTAEELQCSTNSVQNWEKSSLSKCCDVWEHIRIFREIATQ